MHYECSQVLGLCLAGRFLSAPNLPMFDKSELYLTFCALFRPTTDTESASRIGIDSAYLKLKEKRWRASLSQWRILRKACFRQYFFEGFLPP